MLLKRLGFFVLAAAAAGCSSSTSPAPPAFVTPSPTAAPAQVSGDMLAVAANRGWTYQGTAQRVDGTVGPITFTLYADPSSGGSNSLVLFETSGTVANAFSGTKLGAASVSMNGTGYDALTYVQYYFDGSGVYDQGSFPSNTMIVASTLTNGAVSTPYPGYNVSVTSVGTVPGSSACPTPATGATESYVMGSATYTASFVPGCGITNVTGPNIALTLVSVASYPSEGTQVRPGTMARLSLFDTAASLVRHVFHKGSAATMPDVYDTRNFAQSLADLRGRQAGANGVTLQPDRDLMTRTRGAGAIAYLERQLSQAKPAAAGAYRFGTGATVDGASYTRYVCAFGANAAGSGHLEQGHNIGLVWVSNAEGACNTPRSYSQMRALAGEALAKISN